MRNLLMAAVAVAALASGSVAMADEFNGQPTTGDHQTQAGVNTYLDEQATDAQFADPTAPNSLRSHGHP